MARICSCRSQSTAFQQHCVWCSLYEKSFQHQGARQGWERISTPFGLHILLNKWARSFLPYPLRVSSWYFVYSHITTLPSPLQLFSFYAQVCYLLRHSEAFSTLSLEVFTFKACQWVSSWAHYSFS